MMSLRSWLSLLVIYITYLIIGMFSFRALEYCEPEEGVNATGKEPWMEMKFDHSRPSRNQTEQRLQWILKQKIQHLENVIKEGKYINENLSVIINDSSQIPWDEVFPQESRQDCDKWSHWNSLMFSFTAITTIGYGHIFPRTEEGQIVCIFYSILGVPINGILIASLANYFGQKLKKFREKRPNEKSSDNHLIQILLMIVHVTAYLIPGLIIFLLVPSAIFYHIEDWTYLESFYFTFITLTTIGFGDFVAGKDEAVLLRLGNWAPVYEAGIILWVIFGLGYLFMIISIITEMIKSPAKRASKTLKAAERLLVSKILHEIIALRHPEGYDENDVDDENEKEYVRYMDLQSESDENISSSNIELNNKINTAHMNGNIPNKSSRKSVGTYEELTTEENIDSLIDDMNQETITSLHHFLSSAMDAKKELRRVSMGIQSNLDERDRRHSHNVTSKSPPRKTSLREINVRETEHTTPPRIRSRSTAGFERYKSLKVSRPSFSNHPRNNRVIGEDMSFPSVVEEDINELEDEPNKEDQSNVEDKDQKESDKKEENPEVNRGLKEINRCMEDDTSVLAATSKPNVGRFSMSQRTSRNEGINRRKSSFMLSRSSTLPDILKNVTLEEILKAVDNVEEEDEENRKAQETKEQQWNIGVLEGHKGPVFLQSVGNQLHETESQPTQL